MDNQVSAYGEGPDDGMLVFGAFDTVADLTPAYEVQTPITSEETKLFGLRDGRTVVMQAFDGSVELFVVGNDGQLDWGKNFSSATFSGLPSSGILGPEESRTSSVTATANTFIITVTQSNIAIAGSSLMADHQITLVSVSSAGAMQWSRTYTGFSGATAPDVIASESSIYLSSFNTDSSNPMNPQSSAALYKLNQAGNPVWGRRFTNAILSYSTEPTNGKTILVGSQIQGSGINTKINGVMTLVGGNGALERSVSVDVEGQSSLVPATFAGKNKLFLTLIGADEDPKTGLTFGSASHQLDGFVWRKYPDMASSATVIPAIAQKQDGAVFSSFNEITHQLDTFKVTDDLMAGGGSPVFEDAVVTTAAINLASTSATLPSSNATVSMVALTPEFTPTTIEVQLTELDEESLCPDGMGGSVGGAIDSPGGARAGLTIQRTGPSSGALEFQSEANKNYIIERSLTLRPATWTEFQTFSGTGSAINHPVGNDPKEAYFRLSEQ